MDREGPKRRKRERKEQSPIRKREIINSESESGFILIKTARTATREQTEFQPDLRPAPQETQQRTDPRHLPFIYHSR